MIAVGLVGVALGLLFGSVGAYGLAIGSGRNAGLTRAVGVAVAGAGVLAAGGAAWAWRYGSPWPLGVALGLAGVVVLGAALVFGINAIGRVPTHGIRIRVGDWLPEFESLLRAIDEAFGLPPRDGEAGERPAPEPDELGCADCV